MAGNTYQLVVDAVYKGGGAFQQARGDLSGLDNAAKGAGAGLSGSLAKVGIAFGAVSLAVTGVALATKKAYSMLREGATLVTTQQRFDKLSESIGTTADTLLGKLRTATRGMIDDMSLMSSASGIISLRLAENEDQVIRLATVVGTLGWDMQQVILTFANLSTMRLDALGLSVSEVKNKQKELMQEGMDEIAAFKEAVIQAGEARLTVGGVSETEQAFKQLEAAIANSKNELSLMLVDMAKTLGLIEKIGGAAARMELARNIREVNAELIASGQMTPFQNIIEQGEFAGMTTEELAALVATKMEQIDNALLYDEGVWQGWAMGVAVNASEAERAVTIAATNIFRGLIGIQQGLDEITSQAGAGTYGGPMVLNPHDQEWINRQRWRMLGAQARARSADAAGPFANIEETTTALGGYSYALSEVDQREQSLMATHGRMAAAFGAEAFGDAAAGLIDASGAANVEAMNQALYDQAKAAGATAGQLALLGVATGALTEDQARAALKAAILTEQARKLALAVVAGQMGFGEAASGMITFGAELDAQAAGQDLTTLATAADDFAESVYEAELAVDNEAANLGLMASIDLANEYQGTYTATLHTVYTSDGGASGPTGSGPMGGTSSGGTSSGGTSSGGTSSGGTSTYDPGRYGATNKSGGTDILPYGGGSMYSDSRTAGAYTSYQGGSTVNVTVTNYVDGKAVPRSSLDDLTNDSIKRAMAEVGLGKR